jgi:hypothetical protein
MSVWTELHWYNIPDLQTKQISTEQSILTERILPCLNYNNNKPLYIYMYNKNITELETIRHSDEVIKTLNETGIDIYLYEVLCCYDITKTNVYHGIGNMNNHDSTYHTLWFYSEYEEFDSMTMRANELDSILIYKNNNNLTNIRVHTCDYDVDKWYSYYIENGLQLFTNDIFVKTLPYNKYPMIKFNNEFTKKFLCLNWRFTPHRNLLAAYCSQRNSLVSWYYKTNYEYLKESNWYNIEDFDIETYNVLKNGIEYLYNNSPLMLDINVDQAVVLNDGHIPYPNKKGLPIVGGNYESPQEKNNGITTFYKQVFCDVVTESRFAQPTGNYSEKVLQAMWHCKPFILCAPYKTLEYLRNEGYKTFDKFWDESYDNILNPKKRLEAILKVIDSIEQKSIDELKRLYRYMIPILEHNYNMVQKKIYKIGTKYDR